MTQSAGHARVLGQASSDVTAQNVAQPGTAGRNSAPRPMSYAQALENLRPVQKSAKGSPAYSRFVNRRLGRYLAAGAYRLGATPNAVTGVSALFTFAGIAALLAFPPTWGVGILVAACLIVGYALDSADGQLARLLGGGSLSGEWLDHMVDATKQSSLHLATLICAYRYFELDPQALLLVPIGFAIVGAVMFFGMTLNDQLRRNSVLAGGPPVVRDDSSLLKSLLVVPTDYGLLCIVYVLLGSTAVFGACYALLFVGNLLFMILASVKWFNDMKALDRKPGVDNV